jgi:hypothetical protein
MTSTNNSNFLSRSLPASVSASAPTHQNEVWVMEIIGKGNYEKGAVWVAAKIPAGAVSAHANQARITTFPKNKPDEVLIALRPPLFTYSAHICT